MYITTLKITPSVRERQKIIGAFKIIHALTDGSLGCIGCSLYVDAAPGEDLFIMERWMSEEDLRRYLQSDLYRRVLELVELSRELPEIHFYRVVESSGLELVQEIRGQGAE